MIDTSKALQAGMHRAKGNEKLKYYPIFLDIRDKKCVVVGGGEVAARKVSRLLDCGAKVFVISPELSPELVSLKEKNAICHIAAVYTGYFLEGACLVIGATDDEATNERISSDARKKGIAVNIVDDPQKCDFILPSLVQRGDLTIAIGTGGKSPALARRLREELEKQYGGEYEILLNLLGRLRTKMEKNAGVGAEWFEGLMDAGILAAIKEKDAEKARGIVKKITGEDLDLDF
ncbi:MAG TPA: bifunctional precorrin-2 dehydrogenase/sirohydrochlorin ferrochelatase [Smithella sp.]|nr:bifunctional precorrin-2 dehydrogenase/sirohydrochlorin ferrochelatase [Smithella sp.]